MERPAKPLRASDRVLVVRLGALGDVLRALPAVRRLRLAFPGIHLEWVVEDLAAPLLEGHPDLDDVVVLHRRDLRRAGRDPRALARSLATVHDRLRASRFTVAVDLQGTLKSSLVALLSGAPRRVGFAPGFCREMSFLFTNEWVPLSSPWLNRVDRNLEMAVALGAGPGTSEVAAPDPGLIETAAEAEAAAALVSGLPRPGAPLVVLCPGASRRQARKMWPAPSYATLARLVRQDVGARPLVVWGPGERPLADRIVVDSGGAAILAPLTDLRLLAAVLRRADVFVGADTGPMHLAWSVGCPVVALFGPTDPRLNAPRGPGDIVLRSDSDAMSDLIPETVLLAVRARIAAPRSGTRGPVAEVPLDTGRGARA